MVLKVFRDKVSLAQAAAEEAAAAIRNGILQQGKARVVAATGASQFEFLEVLTRLRGIAWERVELFHLDEYVGIAPNHPASFCKYLQERVIRKTGVLNYHFLDGEKNPAEVIRTVGNALVSQPVDVAFVGVGENGHLAFNDPPADFEIEDPYMVVTLDEACRRQQFNEGWFPTPQDVPLQAISMTIRQIMKSKKIICIAPDARKAQAVKECFEGEISPMAPASILRKHPAATVYLDEESAALLSEVPALS